MPSRIVVERRELEHHEGKCEEFNFLDSALTFQVNLNQVSSTATLSRGDLLNFIS